MFEKEISSFAFNIAKRYTGERIPLRTLQSDSELPANFKRFAEAEVDEIIDDEEFGKSKTGKVDMSPAEIQTLFKEIRHSVKSSFEFSRDDFLDLTDKSSKFLFNYIIRPRWTLEKFLFKGLRDISKANFYRAERFLSDYQYYSKGISEYMEFQTKDSIDVDSWRKLHSKIDEHLLSSLPSNAESLTNPLLELFEFAAGYPKIPVDALVLFFRDKSADEIVDRIEFAKEVKGFQSLNSRDVESLLQAPARDMTQTVDLLKPQIESSKDWESFERRAERQHEKTEMKGADDKKEAGEYSSGSNPQSQAEPPQVADALQKTPSVRTLLSAKNEAKIVKKVFGGSKSLYHIAIHKLDESADWKGASKIVEGIFIDRGINPFSKYAVAFTDAISKKFNHDAST
ncbi:MAG TPA: hypothetical protein VLX91_05350 [Candidatus Acidoferrales bacterium]|nr:hypothetical protein [Candidatus Acidoferrales bacterium]